MKDREAWHTEVNEVAKNWTQLSGWTTTASARLKRFVSLFASSGEFFWSFNWEWFLYFFYFAYISPTLWVWKKQTLTVVWRAIYMCEYPWIACVSLILIFFDTRALFSLDACPPFPQHVLVIILLIVGVQVHGQNTCFQEGTGSRWLLVDSP